MIALIWFILAVLASPFKSKSWLEAENSVLRHQYGFAERLIRSIRRECLHHIIVWGEGHLRRNLISYALTTAPSEHSGRCTRMRRFFVRFNRSESFVHIRTSVGFTIITSGFEFPVSVWRCLGPRVRKYGLN
jgi:hypothetical protein